MQKGLSSEARDFFLAAEDLASRGRSTSERAVADAMASYFGSLVTDPAELAGACRSARLLRRGLRGELRKWLEGRAGGSLLPTRRGRRYLETAVDEYYLERGLAESAESAAFRDLCRARQGLGVVQHGSLTAAQLQAIIGHVQVARPARVLDLGCGVGEPGMLIAGACGARLLGVDRSTSAVSLAERSAAGNASFILADLEAYSSSAPRGSADVVLAIDALYWTENLESLLSDVFEILSPGGCFLCISSEFDETRSGAAALAPHDMEIGAALEAVSEERGDLRVESRDFTEEERSLWLGSLALCEGWEEAFTAEGRAYLLRNIVREAEYLESAMRHGRGARRLFAAYRGDDSSSRRSKRSRAAAAVSRALPV